jgi:ABC-type phosphate/phosphonate transport system permease subunit
MLTTVFVMALVGLAICGAIIFCFEILARRMQHRGKGHLKY